jgi:multidrug efflux pump subunit AcrA (membrane-fusion protein)
MLNSTKSKLGAALLLAATAIGGVAWTRSNAPAAPAIVAPAATVLVAPGIVEAEGDRVELGFEASGRIAELAVNEGDRVTAGQVLGRLDDRVARARVARAEAAVAVAKARRDAATHREPMTYDAFRQLMEGEGGFVYAGWNGDPAVEAKVKEETKATIRVIPDPEFRSPSALAKCMVTGEKAKHEVVWAKAY